MRKPERRDAAKERYWRRLLGQWRRSGRTGRDFCAERGLSEPSFYAWRREIARRDQARAAAAATAGAGTATRPPDDAGAPAFRQLTIAGGVTRPPAIDVVVGAPRRLRVRAGFDADLLRQLLAVLEEPSC